MNYIKHLSKVFEIFRHDDRLTPSHISLYFALFQCWNSSRFKNPFSVSRKQILKLSKIGSKSTYQRKIRDLHNWKFIEYSPSHNPAKGSEIIMFDLDAVYRKDLKERSP